MAKIYSAPSEVKQPSLDFKNIQGYREGCEKYKEDLKAFLRSKGYTGKNMGETIQFPVADSYAEYMVASMKPLALVHIPLWDGWDFQYANRLTAKDVQDKLDQEKRMAELFSK